MCYAKPQFSPSPRLTAHTRVPSPFPNELSGIFMGCELNRREKLMKGRENRS